MADKADKIQVQGEGDIEVNKNSAAANDNIEITDASGAAKKVSGQKIELNTKLNLPQEEQANELLSAAAIASAIAANDNIENDLSSAVTTNPSQPAPTTNTPDLPTELPITEPEADIKQQPTPQTSLPTLNKTEDKIEKEPAPTAQETNADNTKQNEIEPEKPILPQENKETPTSQPNKAEPPEPPRTPPTVSKPEQPPANPAPTPSAPAPAPKNTPTVPNESLGQVGPHNLENKSPTTLPATGQSQVGSELSANQSRERNMGQRLGDNISNRFQKGAQNIKNAPRNIVNNIKNNFESDRSRTRQLRQERRQLENELSKLENRIDGVKASGPMRIIKFWFPGIYASISGFGAGIANAKGQAKVALLQTKLLTVETIKGTLKTAEGVSAFIEANQKVITWIVESFETIVIPILLIVTYPIAVLLVWIYIEFMGAIGAPITKSIKELTKQVDKIIENLKKILEPEKKKIKIRRNIQFLNQMLASKNTRKNMDNRPKQEDSESESNTTEESTNYQQPA